MANQVRCPHCGQVQIPTIRVQTIECPSGQSQSKSDPRKTRRVLLMLLLSLTIVGLPLAYWLCQRYEKEYPVRIEPVLKYSYRCSLCSSAWTWRTDEPFPQRAHGKSAQKQTENGSTVPTPQGGTAST